jgi:aldose 1-epimerase
VPFSNRIENGLFAVDGETVRLPPNMPGSAHPHPLHGFGWLERWHAIEANASTAELEHVWPGGDWPWPYRARQRFSLTAEGLLITLMLTNLGDCRMPAGLGLHPNFSCNAATSYRGLHLGEWQTDAECLPRNLDMRREPSDWWNAQPVSRRVVDTAYTGRSGPLTIAWPCRGISLTMSPCDALSTTVVYTPAGANFFCVEPVSHMSNAHNAQRPDSGLIWLLPHDTFTATVSFVADPIVVQ